MSRGPEPNSKNAYRAFFLSLSPFFLISKSSKTGPKVSRGTDTNFRKYRQSDSLFNNKFIFSYRIRMEVRICFYPVRTNGYRTGPIGVYSDSVKKT